MASRRRARRFYTNPKPSAGLSDGAKIALALAGVAVVGGIGYYIYTQSQSSTTAGGTAGGATNASTTLGPVGSSTALPAASVTTDNLPISYEAGAGTNAPLVATGA